MDLLKLNLFRGGIFKQAKFLVSAPQKAGKGLYRSEQGTVSLEVLPLSTGFMDVITAKKTWQADHIYKLRVLKNGEPVQDEAVLPFCDRSYMPLDPLQIIKAKDKEHRRSLRDIAGTRHDQVLIDIGNERDKATDVVQVIVTWSFVIIALAIVARVIMEKIG